MPTADELMEAARACADRLDLSDRRELPSLDEVEDRCGEDYEQLLELLQDDEVLGGVDFDRQQQIGEQIEAALPESKRPLVEELTDQHTRQIWVFQQAAFHVGLAIGLKIAGARREED